MQPHHLILALLATALNLISAQPLPLQQRVPDDNDNFEGDTDVSVSLGPFHVGVGLTNTPAVRSAEAPTAEEDANAIKQLDDDNDDNDVSTQLGATRRQTPPNPSGILPEVLHFPTRLWTAAGDVLDKLTGNP